MPTVDLAAILINAGPAGLVILLYQLGWVTSKPAMERSDKAHAREVTRLEKEVERWRLLHEKECEAHATTRRAHEEEIRPGLQTSAEVARTAVHLLSAVKESQSGAQEARERP